MRDKYWLPEEHTYYLPANAMMQLVHKETVIQSLKECDYTANVYFNGEKKPKKCYFKLPAKKVGDTETDMNHR